VNAVLREITKLWAIRDRLVVRSSVIPSAKYCWSGSLLRLPNGSTTIDRRGATSGCTIDAAAGPVGIGVEETVAWSVGLPARKKKVAAGQNHHAMQTMTSAAAAAVPMMVRLRRGGRADNPRAGSEETRSGRNA
jgi:hypothetical protein